VFVAAFKVKLKFKLLLKCATAADVWQRSNQKWHNYYAANAHTQRETHPYTYLKSL